MNTCRHGHPRTPENTGTRSGRPYCKPCNRVTAHERAHCLDGHRLSPENTYITPAGFKKCRPCRFGTEPIAFSTIAGILSGKMVRERGQSGFYVEIDGEIVAKISVELVDRRTLEAG